MKCIIHKQNLKYKQYHQEKENQKKWLMIGIKLLLVLYQETQDSFRKNKNKYGHTIKVYGLNNGN